MNWLDKAREFDLKEVTEWIEKSTFKELKVLILIKLIMLKGYTAV